MNPLLALGLVITCMGVFADAATPAKKAKAPAKAPAKPKEKAPEPPKPSETPTTQE